ncbi:hypothetical protein JYU14_00580 [Simkania negevensis]|uniref:SAM-dependent MTase RsmB/NOP-type domain-containing protein n=1 Tax=Simkania negevensis TaxID=83561 RepID=A0ABS3AR39_9BACT|nr:hypothetical protein [Simkania negevensis]
MAPSARLAACHALHYFLQNENFIEESLGRWKTLHTPKEVDFRLAFEIASGTVRRKRSLEYGLQGLAKRNSLKLENKKKALLYTALYQLWFLDRIPAYAVVAESVDLAKKLFHTSFASFVNAILRKASSQPITLPATTTPEGLGIHYSYPNWFVEELLRTLPHENVISILAAQNTPPPLMATLLQKNDATKDPLPFTNMPLSDLNTIENPYHSPLLYIQNITQATLTGKLCQKMDAPKTALDICAAPGGKAILLHAAFPQTTIHANDANAKRMIRLQENLTKFHINALLTTIRGEDYPEERKYNLVIVDAPCSNSGVLAKCPEARWRLNKQNIDALQRTQVALLKKAARLLHNGGKIWYLTCSILAQENEAIIEQTCNSENLTITKGPYTQTPNAEGWEGGFACELSSRVE